MSSVQLKRGVNRWHEQLADWLIANPGRTQNEAARHFDVTAAWLSSVVNSDAFQDHYKRKAANHSEALLLGIREQTAGVAAQGLAELGRRMENPRAMPVAEVLAITDTMLKHAKPADAGSRPSTLLVVSKEDLELARQEMRARAVVSATPSEKLIDITPSPGETS